MGGSLLSLVLRYTASHVIPGAYWHMHLRAYRMALGAREGNRTPLPPTHANVCLSGPCSSGRPEDLVSLGLESTLLTLL